MVESVSDKTCSSFCLFQIFLSQIVKLPKDVFDDNTFCFKSRLRSHPTSLCLVALAASDLVFCVYNLPLTAYQVTPHLCIKNSWKRFFSQYFSLYELLKKIISLSIFLWRKLFLSVFSSWLWLFLSGLAALYVCLYIYYKNILEYDFICLNFSYIPFFYYGNIGVSLFIMTLIAVHRVLGVFYGHIINKYFTKVISLSQDYKDLL